MSHSSGIDQLPTEQSIQHILNWFPADYDFSDFQDYMYGGSAGQIFYYWMYEDAPQVLEIGRGGAINQYVEARPVRGEDYAWAVEVFEALDQYLEIDFERTFDRSQANFRLYGTTGHNLGGSGGFADGTQLLNTGYVDVIVNVGELESDLEANDPENTYLALHELGHALGLSHPGLPPVNDTRTGMSLIGINDIPRWDLYTSSDTIMSYNHATDSFGEPIYGDTYTIGDLVALQTIWGEEGSYSPSQSATSVQTQPVTPTTSGLNVISGSNKKDKLKGTNGADQIIGLGGSDKISAKGGDDLIDPGVWNSGKYDKIKGGAGADTFVIKDGYWAFIKDFSLIEDVLDLSGLSGGLDWDVVGKKTYIYDRSGEEVARLKGKIDLSEATIV